MKWRYLPCTTGQDPFDRESVSMEAPRYLPSGFPPLLNELPKLTVRAMVRPLAVLEPSGCRRMVLPLRLTSSQVSCATSLRQPVR
jgi:hypothetical protein